MFKHILIAHDLRDTADLALSRASQLAIQHGAKLTLLHVTPAGQSQGQLEKAQFALDRALTHLAPSGSALRLLSGKASDVVLQELQSGEYDLLVLGGHQQRHDLFSGTSLDRIARRCTVPLLLVASSGDQPYQRAAAALDFSLCACSALSQAHKLLPSSANLHAVHVFEAEKGLLNQQEMQEQLIAQLLHDEANTRPDDGPEITYEVIEGGILRTLQDQVKQRRSELLVLGSHGRGAFSQALLGSLAQHFLHKAPCDVLVVR